MIASTEEENNVLQIWQMVLKKKRRISYLSKRKIKAYNIYADEGSMEEETEKRKS